MSIALNVVMLAGSVALEPRIEEADGVEAVLRVGTVDVALRILDPIVASRFVADWAAGRRHYLVQASIDAVDEALCVTVATARGHEVKAVDAVSAQAPSPPRPAPAPAPAAVPPAPPVPGASPRPEAAQSPAPGRPLPGGGFNLSSAPLRAVPTASGRSGLGSLSKPKSVETAPEEEAEVVTRRPVSRPDLPQFPPRVPDAGRRAAKDNDDWMKDNNSTHDDIPF